MHHLSKGRFTGRSNFWNQLLLKVKEIIDANQHFYELEPMSEKNNWIQRMDRVKRP